MDEHGLPIVGAGIDYSKVKPIDKKRLLAFVNHYVTHTVKFINKFSGVCEEKMTNIETQLQRLEITLNILEAKLSSIPGLDDVKVSVSSEQPQTAGSTANSSDPPAPPSASNVPQSTATSETPSAEPTPDVPQQNEPPAEPDYVKVSQDPRFSRFFKMLNMGVPMPAVRHKIMMEGLNPDLLDTPDAPAPPATNNQSEGDESSDSEAEFSDSD